MNKLTFSFAVLVLSTGAIAAQPDTTTVTMGSPAPVWANDSWGRQLGTVGATVIDKLGYGCATPLNIPGQPIGQDSSVNICGSYPVGGNGWYANQVSSTAYVTAPGADINAVLGTVIATIDGGGGSGVVGVGVVESPNGVGFGSELAALCFVEPGCAQAVALQLESGGNAQPNSPVGNYLRFMSGANGNSPFTAIRFGDGLHNTIQEGGTLFAMWPGNWGSSGFDLRCGGCLDRPFISDNFAVDNVGDVTARAFQIPALAGSGSTHACIDNNGVFVRCP